MFWAFFIIMCMRVVQNICGKTASKMVQPGEVSLGMVLITNL